MGMGIGLLLGRGRRLGVKMSRGERGEMGGGILGIDFGDGEEDMEDEGGEEDRE